MACKGICVHHKTVARYVEGSKRCKMCDIFIRWDGARCPCCKYALRSKARFVRHHPRESEGQVVVRYVQ
jgi:hypothetical protein